MRLANTMIDRRREAELLERLCFYRALYARRGQSDGESVLSIPAAVSYGEMLMRVARRRDDARSRRRLHQNR